MTFQNLLTDSCHVSMIIACRYRIVIDECSTQIISNKNPIIKSLLDYLIGLKDQYLLTLQDFCYQSSVTNNYEKIPIGELSILGRRY